MKIKNKIKDVEKMKKINITHFGIIGLLAMLMIGASGKEKFTQEDVWDMEHDDSEYFVYVPLRARKAEYKGIEYFYLSDNQGAMYIEFDEELEDGGNYIAEIGRYTDEMYELEKSDFTFTREMRKSFSEYERLDSEVAEDIVKEMTANLDL